MAAKTRKEKPTGSTENKKAEISSNISMNEDNKSNKNTEIAKEDTIKEILSSTENDTSLEKKEINGTISSTKRGLQKAQTYLHLIDGEKGGVGKSFFARALCHYFENESDTRVSVVDADATNPDVFRVYGGQEIIFSEDEQKSFDADEIFNIALSQSVLVNLPAQISNVVNSWYERNNILELAKQPEVNIKICKWFVSTGAFDSIELFKKSLSSYGGMIQHILIQNLAFRDEWKSVADELKEETEKYSVLRLDFPKLAYKERDFILKEQLKFENARVAEEIGILGRQRVETFIKSFVSSIKKVEENLHK